MKSVLFLLRNKRNKIYNKMISYAREQIDGASDLIHAFSGEQKAPVKKQTENFLLSVQILLALGQPSARIDMIPILH